MNDVMNAAPARVIVCTKLDTLGDLVLFAPVLQALRRECPAARIVTIIRPGYVELANRLVDGVEWVTTTINAFADTPSGAASAFTALREVVNALRPDWFIAATSRRTWVEIALAAMSGATRRIAAGPPTDEFFATQLKITFNLSSEAAFNEAVELPADEPAWRANFRTLDVTLGRPVPRTMPTLALGPSDADAAASILQEHGLTRGEYLVCAAAGFANVTLKTWPADRFAAILRHVAAVHGRQALLVGADSERAYLQSLATAAGGVPVWTGGDQGLPTLAALIQGARLYLGNDTGAMHLAAALDTPVVAIFGGGTWPRFVPAGRRCLSVVQPLPCFGCGWDCAFGDAPCLTGIAVEPVREAVDRALATSAPEFSAILPVEVLPASTRELMGKAARQYRESRAGHLARQHKLEELTALDREKDTEIESKDRQILAQDEDMKAKDRELVAKDEEIQRKDREIGSLKATCTEREQTVIRVDGHAQALQARVVQLEADHALLQQTVATLPPDRQAAAKAMFDLQVHARNLEALRSHHERELTELKAVIANRAAGLHDLEQAKHYGQLLAAKEAVIRSLQQACVEREVVIKQLTAEITAPTAAAHKAWNASHGYWREKIRRPLEARLFRSVVERYWMQIGVLQHYRPKPLVWDDRIPTARGRDADLPQIGIVTPSYGQEKFIERTLRSILDQQYPKLRYVVQDGGSKDGTMAIVARYADRLQHAESARDQGQADAIVRGFRHLTDTLGPDDLMAWLNSDDLLGPGALRYVAEYFTQHPEVDVVYGHRIIIDEQDRDVGRWIMPRHHPATLEWIDYVPQETLFWRKRAWDLVGGVDPSFQFALDWDLLARFHQANCRMVRLPYFLGAFRVHTAQKTSQAIHTIGAEEMRRIRTRFHGERHDDGLRIEHFARQTRFWGAVTARLLEIGIRW